MAKGIRDKIAVEYINARRDASRATPHTAQDQASLAIIKARSPQIIEIFFIV